MLLFFSFACSDFPKNSENNSAHIYLRRRLKFVQMAFPLTSHPTISLAHVSPRKSNLLTRAYSSFPNSRKKKLRMNCLFGKKDIFGTGVKNWVKKGHSLNIKTYQRVIILLTLDAFSSEMMK